MPAPIRQEKNESSIEEALRRVRAALEGMRYGEVVVKVQAGKVVWVDRYERERVGSTVH